MLVSRDASHPQTRWSGWDGCRAIACALNALVVLPPEMEERLQAAIARG